MLDAALVMSEHALIKLRFPQAASETDVCCWQALDHTITAMRGQCERDMQQQATLSAAAEANVRSISDRDDFMREVAATCGFSELAGTVTLSEADINRWAGRLGRTACIGEVRTFACIGHQAGF